MLEEGPPDVMDHIGGNVFFHKLPVQVRFYYCVGISDIPLDAHMNSLRCDIQRALGECAGFDDVMRDPSSPGRRVGITQVGDFRLYREPHDMVGFDATAYALEYHHLKADPRKWDDDDILVSDNGLHMGSKGAQ
jgi:hypothetical protein